MQFFRLQKLNRNKSSYEVHVTVAVYVDVRLCFPHLLLLQLLLWRRLRLLAAAAAAAACLCCGCLLLLLLLLPLLLHYCWSCSAFFFPFQLSCENVVHNSDKSWVRILTTI